MRRKLSQAIKIKKKKKLKKYLKIYEIYIDIFNEKTLN